MEKYYYISRRQNETNDENDLSYLLDVLGERAREIRRAVPHAFVRAFFMGEFSACVF